MVALYVRCGTGGIELHQSFKHGRAFAEPVFFVCFGSEFLVMPAVFRSLEMNIFMHVRCYFDWHHMNLKSPALDTWRSSGCEA